MNNDRNSLSGLLAPYVSQSGQDLERWLVEPDTPASLAEAMRYCILGGGKRLRPAIVFLCARACGQAEPAELTRRAAAAVEMVHAYSLVHDDLPAMDNDVLRRGVPTAHVKFGQAMAILAGDALLTRAFGVLAETGDPSAARLVRELSAGSGCSGMIAGQVADMNLCDVPPGPAGLQYVHTRKTGKLIRAAGRMGAICAGAGKAALAAVTECTEALGLAFQLVDDVLDVTGHAQDIGKTPGKDARVGKKTYVSELGLEQTRKLAAELTARAAAALAALGDNAEPMRRLAELLADRTH